MFYNYFTLTETASAEISGLKNNEDRAAYLESLGWAILPTPLAVETLLIPEEFDSSYDEYLALQANQGFDLNLYRGKKITRYTYEVTNYPTGESGVQVSLLLYKNTVIGGEIFSSASNSFLHGLTAPEK